jgi:hypothetical protein
LRQLAAACSRFRWQPTLARSSDLSTGYPLLELHLARAREFVDAQTANGGVVLVHCFAGVRALPQQHMRLTSRARAMDGHSSLSGGASLPRRRSTAAPRSPLRS